MSRLFGVFAGRLGGLMVGTALVAIGAESSLYNGQAPTPLAMSLWRSACGVQPIAAADSLLFFAALLLYVSS
jgi:hypothetical protein